MNKLAKFLEKQAAQLVIPGLSAAVAADIQEGNTDDKIISSLSAAAGAGLADAYTQSKLIEKYLPKLQKLHAEGKIELPAEYKSFRTALRTPGKFIKQLNRLAVKKLIGVKGVGPAISLTSALLAGSLGGAAGLFAGQGINELKDKF